MKRFNLDKVKAELDKLYPTQVKTPEEVQFKEDVEVAYTKASITTSDNAKKLYVDVFDLATEINTITTDLGMIGLEPGILDDLAALALEIQNIANDDYRYLLIIDRLRRHMAILRSKRAILYRHPKLKKHPHYFKHKDERC